SSATDPLAVRLAAGRRLAAQPGAGRRRALAALEPGRSARASDASRGGRRVIDFWPHLLRPAWLLVLPLCGWLLWKLWHRQRRAGRWQLLLPQAFHDVLLSGGAGQNGRLRWVVLGCAWLLALLALLGPSWQRIEQP